MALEWGGGAESNRHRWLGYQHTTVVRPPRRDRPDLEEGLVQHTVLTLDSVYILDLLLPTEFTLVAGVLCGCYVLLTFLGNKKIRFRFAPRFGAFLFVRCETVRR
jgi:hypothetical protein